MLARVLVVFLVITGLVVDHNLCVLAVLCGENSSKNPIISGLFCIDCFMFFLTVFQHLGVFYSLEDRVFHI